MNKLAITVVVILVLLAGAGGAGYFLLGNINGLVKELIETVGSDSLNSEVKVAKVDIKLTEGAGHLSGLTVANPQGFSAESLFSMDGVGLSIDTGSLTEDVYVIKEISIDGAKILAEQTGRTTNLQALLDSIDSGSEGGNGSESGSDTTETPNIKLAVDKISFTNGAVTLRSDVLGEKQFTLPELTMREIGTRENGLSPDELGEAITKALLKEVKDAVMDEVEDLAKEAAKAKLREKIGDRAADGLEKLKGLFK